MSSNTPTTLNDKQIIGTIAMLKDNNAKLEIIDKIKMFQTTLISTPINENDVKSIVSLCLEHLQSSHMVFGKATRWTHDITRRKQHVNKKNISSVPIRSVLRYSHIEWDEHIN